MPTCWKRTVGQTIKRDRRLQFYVINAHETTTLRVLARTVWKSNVSQTNTHVFITRNCLPIKFIIDRGHRWLSLSSDRLGRYATSESSQFAGRLWYRNATRYVCGTPRRFQRKRVLPSCYEQFTERPSAVDLCWRFISRFIFMTVINIERVLINIIEQRGTYVHVLQCKFKKLKNTANHWQRII